ncbi:MULTISPECIES: hypothetical protein [Streptomyces]|uniref:hypothetical protein n=1 Tax=Streptomyces TaxID=1883 RepID=UPI0004BDA39B|nr:MULTISPECIES: hypothetical protein [Streptomyces]KOU22010.1 hypothetical protein ADK49_08630 [Streptomyces sp. WM6349]KOU82028.1 hypothetical protein ADK94_25610 [Streptomyces sp. XY593]KOV45857.1 hypothetical protein ADK98_14110 [Streptomyces sp. H036]GLV94743.1 hypothetical protein Slala04_61970 [Streptomyces lavendulae subsp. lavendulae]
MGGGSTKDDGTRGGASGGGTSGGGGTRGAGRTPGSGRDERIRGRSPDPERMRTGGRPRTPDEVAHERGREDATMRDVMRDLDQQDLDDMRDDR